MKKVSLVYLNQRKVLVQALKSGLQYVGKRAILVNEDAIVVDRGKAEVSLARLPRYIEGVGLFVHGPDELGLYHFGPKLVTANRDMVEVLFWAARWARSPDPILILGPTGSGKEEVARFIHRCSGVKGEFVAVNLGAINKELVSSELFGHVKGAFTGATGARKGLFEAASGGSLFLDELGEAALQVQVALLRVVERGVIRPLGATRPIRVNTRIIAATNKDLAYAVLSGEFRHDLYERLATFVVQLPPLSDRPEDVVPLATYLARQAGCDLRLDPRAEVALVVHPWPGNVRELGKVVRRLCYMSEGVKTEGDVSFALNINRPYLAERGWGANVGYTIMRLRQRGFTHKDIYEALGIPRSTYFKRLKALSDKRQTTGQAQSRHQSD